jgi:hypothetical protein
VDIIIIMFVYSSNKLQNLKFLGGEMSVDKWASSLATNAEYKRKTYTK